MIGQAVKRFFLSFFILDKKITGCDFQFYIGEKGSKKQLGLFFAWLAYRLPCPPHEKNERGGRFRAKADFSLSRFEVKAIRGPGRGFGCRAIFRRAFAKKIEV